MIGSEYITDFGDISYKLIHFRDESKFLPVRSCVECWAPWVGEQGGFCECVLQLSILEPSICNGLSEVETNDTTQMEVLELGCHIDCATRLTGGFMRR